MTYVSELGKIPVVDWSNYKVARQIDFINGEHVSCGYVPRDYSEQPAGSIEFCSPLPHDFIFPRSEWLNLIKVREESGSTLRELRQRAGIKTKSQNGTNHCWAYGSVAAAQLAIAASGAPHVELSPTAVACWAKNFRNVGGNTFSAIPKMAEIGIPTTKSWRLNDLSRSNDTEAVREEAAKNKLLEWYELPSNNFDAAASCLLRGIPVILGLMWWGHMVCGVDLVALPGGKFGILIENSHGEGYGDKGLAVLDEERATAFDQAAPRVLSLNDYL